MKQLSYIIIHKYIPTNKKTKQKTNNLVCKIEEIITPKESPKQQN
jgi:hypothetical protein